LEFPSLFLFTTMRYSNYIGVFAGVLVLVLSFQNWIYIPSLQIHVTGMGAAVKTVFGKPALMHFYLLPVMFVLFLVSKIWAKRINPFVGAINFAWAFRNLLLLSTCRNGECPEKTSMLYVYFFAALIVLIMSMLPRIKTTSSK
jgi:hypothetical protein